MRILTTLLSVIRICITLLVIISIVVGIVIVITLEKVILCFRFGFIMFIGPIDADDVKNATVFLFWSWLKIIAFEPGNVSGVKRLVAVLRIDHDHGVAGAIFCVSDEHSRSSSFSVLSWMFAAAFESTCHAECLCILEPFWTFT